MGKIVILERRMLKSITHRRRLLRKNFRLPHQRNRSLNKVVIKKSNKPYITGKNSDISLIKKPKRRHNSSSSYKMAYRYKYYKINELISEESSNSNNDGG